MYITPDSANPHTGRAALREQDRREALAALDRRYVSRRAGTTPQAAAVPVDIGTLVTWIRRAFWWIAAIAVVGALAGFAFGEFVTPKYTATADLLVDPSDLQVVANDVLPQSLQSDAQLLEVESKLRVLTAGATLADVVQSLHLDHDPEFVPPRSTSLLSRLFGGSQPKLAETPAATALRNLQKRVSASREQRSYVVTLKATSADPEKAVVIANAVVSAFRQELAKTDADAAGQAATALTQRLAGLKAAASAAEDKVANFRRQHDLQQNGTQLSSSVSLAQINTQVIDATNRLNDAEAHYQQLASAGGDAAAAQATDSPTMTALRTQYSTLKQQVDSLSLTLGPRHPTLLALESQLAVAKGQIDQETARVVRAAQTQVDQAKAALAALRKQAGAANQQVFADNDAMVELNQLERDAQAQATIYQTFLARARTIGERQQINSTNIRMITPPVLPDSRSYPPRTLLLIAAGAIAGLGLGAALAVGLGLLRRLPESKRRP